MGGCLITLTFFLAGAGEVRGLPRQEAVGSKSVELPVSGKAESELEDVESAIIGFMKARSIEAGSFAIGRKGEVVYSRGFGWSDGKRIEALEPGASFRIASLSKPLTAAAIYKLERDGKLNLDDSSFSHISGIVPTEDGTADPRLGDITIRHLLEHHGGWDRDRTGFDPMFESLRISRELKLKGPATSLDTIRWMASRPLDFAPGERSCYSNFGYCLLGRVIEGASDKQYIEFLRDDVMLPIDAGTCRLARTRREDCASDEPVYVDPHRMLNVLVPGKRTRIAAPYGGFCIEAMDAHGGLIASAPDLCKFMNAYWISGHPRLQDEARNYVFFGSLPGTFTCMTQRSDGVVWAALFNQREDPSGLKYDLIRQEIDAALDQVAWR